MWPDRVLNLLSLAGRPGLSEVIRKMGIINGLNYVNSVKEIALLTLIHTALLSQFSDIFLIFI